jgi:hypothetical protein
MVGRFIERLYLMEQLDTFFPLPSGVRCNANITYSLHPSEVTDNHLGTVLEHHIPNATLQPELPQAKRCTYGT